MIDKKIKPKLKTGLIILIGMITAIIIGVYVTPQYTIKSNLIDMKTDLLGRYSYTFEGKTIYPAEIKTQETMVLTPVQIEAWQKERTAIPIVDEIVINTDTSPPQFTRQKLGRHWGIWSLLPAIIAILLCWVTREPITSLFGGIVVGAILMGKYNLTEDVLVKELSTASASGIIVLYLWSLGGLMGIWKKTGAGKCFGEWMSQTFVVGPRSAKFVGWLLGVIFFQGGTMSTVIVGTTIKPIADREKIAHEEIAYIVDSTASPIASQLAFNAWPGYIQAFIYVSGVAWLATEVDRITFFFSSVPFCFYAIFAVLGTFLLSINKSPFIGKKLRAAIDRANTTGQLDSPTAKPMSSKELDSITVPSYYSPHLMDFLIPLLFLLTTAIGTFIATGVPQIRWAFGGALLIAAILSLFRGLSLVDLMDGIKEGLKGIVVGSIILLLAIIIGSISKQTGGGDYLVALLGETLPYWTLPILLQLMTVIIAFSTGTSWGTYAITFPLAMPLSWAIASSQGLAHPEFFMTLCFAAVMDGSVFGDQCSPISDTTILSSMCTGCDLMDHVKTQIPQASLAACLAAILWTSIAYLFC